MFPSSYAKDWSVALTFQLFMYIIHILDPTDNILKTMKRIKEFEPDCQISHDFTEDSKAN